MNHLIFSAVLTACLGIGGHQHTFKPHRPFQDPTKEYYYKEPSQLNFSQLYSWPALVLPHSLTSIAVYILTYYMICTQKDVLLVIGGIPNCYLAHWVPSVELVFPRILVIYTDGLSKKGFAAQHEGSKLEVNFNDWLEIWAAWLCDLQLASDQEVIP
ncbi:hypothetical protein DSO57_1000915 [Entomophthora muscae]|uniref:Uncharacterized protein n=1 Tax=Entomophthora muscae TaxID=34485 RepID=A0ACC2TL46_9FUNG|nr:hypothetical protein DSO57_1000915 [Entomophthora muscae]